MGYFELHVIIERMLFFANHPLRIPLPLGPVAQRVGRDRVSPPANRETPVGLGGKLLEKADSLDSFARLVHRMRRMAEQFRDILHVLHSVAMAMGLLGCLSVLIERTHSGVASSDAIRILGLGLVITRWGLLIAIPASVAQSWVGRNADRRVEQILLVLDGLSALREGGLGGGGQTTPKSSATKLKHAGASTSARSGRSPSPETRLTKTTVDSGDPNQTLHICASNQDPIVLGPKP